MLTKMLRMSLLKKRIRKGFTLIELLVVVSIVGLLASVVIVSVSGSRKKAQDGRIKSDIRQILIAAAGSTGSSLRESTAGFLSR